jgi:hypothetical protein
MKRSCPSAPPRPSSSALHGRGRFFVSPGEEAVHACKAQVGGLQRRPPWRGRVLFLNAKEEAVHVRKGQVGGLLQ